MDRNNIGEDRETKLDCQTLYDATFEISELIEQIEVGFKADEVTNAQKLEIARKYGPLLLQLKKNVKHGEFKTKTQCWFKNVSYAKINRWMYIAKHECDVARALAEFPDIAWGPKKMYDHLKGKHVKTRVPPDEDDSDESIAVGEVDQATPRDTHTHPKVSKGQRPTPTSPTVHRRTSSFGGEIRKLAGRCNSLLQRMDSVDWQVEDEKKFMNAVSALKKSIADLSAKARSSMKSKRQKTSRKNVARNFLSTAFHKLPPKCEVKLKE